MVPVAEYIYDALNDLKGQTFDKYEYAPPESAHPQQQAKQQKDEPW